MSAGAGTISLLPVFVVRADIRQALVHRREGVFRRGGERREIASCRRDCIHGVRAYTPAPRMSRSANREQDDVGLKAAACPFPSFELLVLTLSMVLDNAR